MLNSGTERTLLTLALRVEVWQLQVLLLPNSVFQVFLELSPTQPEGIFLEPLYVAAEVFAPGWGQTGLLEFTLCQKAESFMLCQLFALVGLRCRNYYIVWTIMCI